MPSADVKTATVAMDASTFDRYTVDGVGRIYTDGEQSWPSVSTVLDVLEKPEALKRWEKTTDNAEAIMTYKQNRGTIAHANCLQTLVPTDEDGTPTKQLWGKDEQSSKDEMEANGTVDTWQTESEWIETAWEKIMRVVEIDTVLDVEKFVVNTDVGYSGQFDLLYRDANGDVVVADIKTGKYVYDKNQLQLSAYANAVSVPVDRVEVLRMNPDFRDWEISRSTEWERSLTDLFTEFRQLRQQLPDEQIQQVAEQAKAGDAMHESLSSADTETAGDSGHQVGDLHD